MSDTPPPALDTGAPPPPPAAPWYNGVADQEFIGTVQNRGLDKKDALTAAQDFYKAHREATQMISKITGTPDKDRILITPKPDAPQAEKDAFYQRLGRPAKAEEYDFSGLKFPDGMELDDGFVDWLRGTSFKANASKEQAAEFGNEFVKWMANIRESDKAVAAADFAAERAALQKNWGANMENNMFVARAGMAKLGFTGEQIQSMEKASGYRAVMEAGLKAGIAFGEDKFIANRAPGMNGVMTVEGAKARMAERRQDSAWAARAATKGTQENLEWEALIVAMTPNPGG